MEPGCFLSPGLAKTRSLWKWYSKYCSISDLVETSEVGRGGDSAFTGGELMTDFSGPGVSSVVVTDAGDELMIEFSGSGGSAAVVIDLGDSGVEFESVILGGVEVGVSTFRRLEVVGSASSERSCFTIAAILLFDGLNLLW